MALLFDSWLLELTTLLLTLCACVYVYFILCYQHWKKKGIPYAPPTFPFGNLSDVVLQRKNLSANYDAVYRQLQGHALGGFYQVNRPTLLLRDPDAIKAVLVKDFGHFQDHGLHVDEVGDPLSRNLFMIGGVEWRHLRQKLSPAFSSNKTRGMFRDLVECGEELKRYLAPFANRNDTIEVTDIAARFMTDVIATCAFGIQSNSLRHPDAEFRTMGRRIFEPTFRTAVRNLLLFMAPHIGDLVNLPIVPRDVSDFFIGVVRESVEYRERNETSRRNDFLQLLIDTKNNRVVAEGSGTKERNDRVVAEGSGTKERNDLVVAEGSGTKERNVYDVNGMTIEEITAQVFIFFSAGFETTSNAVSLCLYELALNQGIQDELREEIDAAVQQHGGRLTYEAVLGMQYLDRVAAETLRKYPTFPFLARVCNKEYQLPGSEVKLEVGTGVVVPTLSLHHDPRYYPNPEEFDPNRFTEEAKRTRHHYTYLPFGEGPRICIGSKFGQMQFKVAIASFVADYKVGVCEKLTSIPLVMDPTSFMLTPRGGIKLTISERS